MSAAVISVIGPDRTRVEAVAAALRARLPGRRFTVGAGPDAAVGVIAVTGTGQDADGADARIVRAVRDTMGGCVLYTGAGTAPAEGEPGVTVVRHGAGGGAAGGTGGAGQAVGPVDGAAGVPVGGAAGDPALDPGALDRLAAVAGELWVDVPRWLADARRADADRIDRVRVAVRLSAERHAGVLLDEALPEETATPEGRARLDALFRARLRCTVLEQGVEWPNLPDPGVDPPTERTTGPDRQRMLVLLAASCGAGVAAALAVGRVVGPLVGLLVGVLVASVTAGLRWRMLAGVRRARAAVAGAAQLRRAWSAVATEVVARLRISPVVDAVSAEVAEVAR